MKLKVLGSSSSGNGYILEGEKETLLIEAGVPVSLVRKRVEDFRTIVGCLVSHRHGDHAKYIADYEKAGIRVYAPYDVWEHIDPQTAPYRRKFTLNNCETKLGIGHFHVIPVQANHDVPCLSFFIEHREIGNLVFITDSNDLGYVCKDTNHLLIECNWSEELLQQAISEGRTLPFVAYRVRKTHMGLEDAVNYIRKDVSMDTLREIVLLHLSHENSDPALFTETMVDAFHKPTFVAAEGLEVDLMK